ncbi:MAG: helix-turn-helix domain-containing protein [Nitriliruptor sp.]|nr:MAG: helix-turn-helix domain-containing protein [Nitriliruptor sp.]
MARTATTTQVAAALHVKPATVRKYAREHRLPFDTTPGGHRRFSVEEAVRAVLGEHDDEAPGVLDGEDAVDTVPYVRVAPKSVLAATVSAARVTPATVRVHDTARDVEDWAEETTVV